MLTPDEIADLRQRIKDADAAGNMVTLPGGALTEALTEIERLRILLLALYGTVNGVKSWEKRWPVISASVKEALGQ